jgi:nucleotide-binding universal stress UspA family protein
MVTSRKHFVVVVAHDLSEQADWALEQAIDLAKAYESTDLHILGVIENRSSFSDVIGSHKIDYAAAEKAQEVLRTIADKKLLEAKPDGIKLFVHGRLGSPAKEIVELAGEAEADMIVVGTHGRSGMGRLLLGSVAEKVVRFAPCPVLVARPQTEHAAPDPAFEPEPACEACVAKRKETNGAVWWCEEHAHRHAKPHIYSYKSGIAQKRPDYAPLL